MPLLHGLCILGHNLVKTPLKRDLSYIRLQCGLPLPLLSNL